MNWATSWAMSWQTATVREQSERLDPGLAPPSRCGFSRLSDFRYYDTEAPDYTGCRYDSPRFHRIKAKLLTDGQLKAEPVDPNSVPGVKYGNAFPEDEALEQLFIDRDLKSEWAIPLLRRRWGPLNRGQVWLREMRARELFGPDARDPPAPECEGCEPPPPPEFPPELRVSHVTQFGNTTATWLDGALWILTVDAQFAEHIYHFSTRILSLFSAQRHNGSHVRHCSIAYPMMSDVLPRSSCMWRSSERIRRTAICCRLLLAITRLTQRGIKTCHFDGVHSTRTNFPPIRNSR